MFKSEFLTLHIDEEAGFLGHKRKISVFELSEFLRVLSVSYTIASHIDSNAFNTGIPANIDSCLREILLLENSPESSGIAETFSKNIDTFSQKYFSQSYIYDQLEIVSINYNSPLNLVISGRSIRTLLLAVAILGGEVSMSDYSVKMPGIAEAINKLSTTYLEVIKYQDEQESINSTINKHLMSLPHKDIDQLNMLTDKT